MTRPVKRRRMRMLDELGEEKLFALYVEIGTVRGLADEMFEAHGGGERPSPRYIYDWLHAEEGRYERWRRMVKMRGHVEADMAYEEAMEATEDNARSQKIKVDTLKWRASVLNREAYGNKVSHDVSGTVEHQWLEAMQSADDEPEKIEGPEGDEDDEIPEADYEFVDEDDDE